MLSRFHISLLLQSCIIMKAKIIDLACKLHRLLLSSSERTRQSYQGVFMNQTNEWTLNQEQPNRAVSHPLWLSGPIQFLLMWGGWRLEGETIRDRQFEKSRERSDHWVALCRPSSSSQAMSPRTSYINLVKDTPF